MKSIQFTLSLCVLLSSMLGFSSTALSSSPVLPSAKTVKPIVETTVKKPAKSTRLSQSVNVNNASAEEISLMLKGIGLKKAQAIIDWRKANGKFTHIDQLLEVKGIGEKILAANKTKIAL